MEPASVVASAAGVASTLSALQSTSETVPILLSELKTLETRSQRVQEWLHFTDLPSKMKVMPGLAAAVMTVDAALKRLHHDSQIPRGGARIDESQMVVHLVDISECSALMHFALNVCQL
jgi:hypothetical protein